MRSLLYSFDWLEAAQTLLIFLCLGLQLRQRRKLRNKNIHEAERTAKTVHSLNPRRALKKRKSHALDDSEIGLRQQIFEIDQAALHASDYICVAVRDQLERRNQ